LLLIIAVLYRKLFSKTTLSMDSTTVTEDDAPDSGSGCDAGIGAAMLMTTGAAAVLTIKRRKG
jgi:hypothetical protein